MPLTFRSRALSLLVAATLPCVLFAAPQSTRSATPAKTAVAIPDISGARVRAHVEFLADDLLEGREAGTRGFDLAARYVATELEIAGLKPGADDGTWFQKVPLRKSSLVSSELLVASGDGAPQPLAVPDEGIVSPSSANPDVNVTGPLAYVGYGISAPDMGHDDYAGLDVRGKIVLARFGAPAAFPSEVRAHYTSPVQKFKAAADHGAVGFIIMFSADDQKRIPWDLLKSRANEPGFTTLEPDGSPFVNEPRIAAVVAVSSAGATKLFAGAPVTAEEAASASAPKPIPLATTVTIRAKATYSAASSENIVGRLAGTDPALSQTSVVLTAHLDHLGIGHEVNGDKINNGAYDNATGSAILLEVAQALGRLKPRPKRSILIVFVTAEEKGLIGSDYFGRHPMKSAGKIVAAVNLDMPVFMAASSDIVAFGAENSTLDRIVRRAAAAEGFTLSPDPMPEQTIFVRSDQYSLVKHGVPAVYLMPGFTAKDPKVNGAEVFQTFLQKHYHKPSDDLTLPMDVEAAERFARANYRVIVAIANDPVAPTWKPGNFFGRTFAGTR
jgi:Zn-dependent M28 family amino/carboxypeptidase